MSEKPKKRLVSWTEYVLRKTLAISLSASLSVCAVASVLLVLGLPYSYYWEVRLRAEEGPPSPSDNFDLTGLGFYIACWLCLILLPILGIAASVLWCGSRKSWKTVRALQPIHYADTSNLPEVETLVRASDRPSGQQAELLRAAPQGSETPAEELLRATTSRQAR